LPNKLAITLSNRIKMKALVLENKELPLILKEVEKPFASKGEALVRILAAAINHRDLWIQKGRYAGLKYPIIPGSDGAGIVSATGDEADAGWIGKEVIINPSLGWGKSQSHQEPATFHILGLPENGCLAEWIKVPVSSLVPRPSELSFEEAAALPLAGLTAYRAVISRGNLQAGEKVLITGIGGGVALYALQYSIAANGEVYVSSGDEEKLRRATGLGARAGFNYKKENWVGDAKARAGSFDLIIDGAGGNELNNLLDLAKPGGRVVTYGSTLGNPGNIELRRIFWKQLNLLGSTMGSPEDFQSMVEFVRNHRIRPIVDKIFSLVNGNDALKRMDAGHQFGKIVIRIP
jgi:NADPH:quinone reductase-like Zn-dependent oxidoreductase